MAQTMTLVPGDLARQLRRAERRKRAFAVSLALPLLVFLLAVFLIPIGALLVRAVENPEVARVLGDQSHRARVMTMTAEIPAADITRGHAVLVDALRRQNPQEAELIRRQQMSRSGHRIFEYMKQRESAG